MNKAALRARFVGYELPAEFVANLRADRDAIADANRRNQAQSGAIGRNQAQMKGGVENTGLIGQPLGQANNEVAGLDAIMHNNHTRQPEKLRAWQSASRVERALQREKKSVVNLSGASASLSAKAA